MKAVVLIFVLACSGWSETLSQKTLQEFDAYMQHASKEMSGNPRFWVEQGSGRREEVLKGHITTGYYHGKEPRKVTDGLVHDWVGTIFIPQARLSEGLRVLRDYDRHSATYAPEMVSSRLTSSADGQDRTTVRIMKRKVITVVLEADFVSTLRVISPAKAIIEVKSSRISEVDNPGAENETTKAPDTGFGFLWRLNSWYLLEERPNGLWIQLRSISLTRGIPLGLGGIVGPMVNSLPRESLASTLDKTRKAIQPGR
jgi:hypothetical protein